MNLKVKPCVFYRHGSVNIDQKRRLTYVEEKRLVFFAGYCSSGRGSPIDSVLWRYAGSVNKTNRKTDRINADFRAILHCKKMENVYVSSCNHSTYTRIRCIFNAGGIKTLTPYRCSRATDSEDRIERDRDQRSLGRIFKIRNYQLTHRGTHSNVQTFFILFQFLNYLGLTFRGLSPALNFSLHRPVIRLDTQFLH